MRKVWAILCGCVSLFFTCKAGSREDSIQQIIRDRSLLWKITGNEMRKPSFVFGTVHVICKDDYLWTSAMKKSLKSTKEVCFEMDMDDPSVMTTIGEGMIDKSGKQLSDYFSADDYDLIKRFFVDSLGMNSFMIGQLKPVALISLLASSSLSCANQVSYENNIMQEAKKMKMEITGLENPLEQLTLMESLPADSIISEVLSMIKGSNSADKKEYNYLVSAYRKQDIAMLYKLMTEQKQNDINLNSFLDDRNMKWIDRMEERMDQNPVFFAVGAGHLWGDNGIINLLRTKGYKVEAVK